MPELCTDDEVDAIVGSVLQEVQEYFALNKFTVYPGAVSSIGALRYGGNSIYLNGKRHQLDHDVDLLVVGPPGSTLSEISMDPHKLGLESHLAKKGRNFGGFDVARETFSLAAAAVRVSIKGVKDKHGKNYGLATLRISSPSNALQRRFEQQEFLFGVDHITELFQQTPFQGYFDFTGNATKSAYKQVKDQIYPTNGTSRPWVQVDLFFRYGPQDSLQPHASKRMLFHGITFRAPAAFAVLEDALSMAFWYKNSNAGHKIHKFGLCGFSLPESMEGFEDDMPNTQENLEVAKRCTSALEAHGYESFSRCHGQKSGETPW